MGGYRIELAQATDDGDLRTILAATPMPGMVSVGFRREPNYFDAAVVEGHFRQVVVARDEASGRLVGFGSRSVCERYVNGRPAPIGYLSSLRLLPAHRRGMLVARGYAFFRKLHEDRRTPLYVTTIAADNRAALKLLTDGRAGLPSYHRAGDYCTMAIPLSHWEWRRGASPGLVIRSAQPSDAPAVLEFLRTTGPRRQCFPCYQAEDLFSDNGLLRGLQPKDLLLAFRGGHLVGTLGAWDQYQFRQMVIHAYGRPLNWLRPLYNCCARLRRRSILPRPGRPMRCLIAALPLARDDDAGVFRALLDTTVRERNSQSWDNLLVGMHESDPLCPVLREYRARCYTTHVYLACWEDGDSLRRSLDGRPLYLELGSL